ncbi:MAG TPA: M1 family metallopeptidase [Candidatus Binataceae bacterium]|nr:M1 family metallopeptidase [Candidatus Binataceae bacterium]
MRDQEGASANQQIQDYRLPKNVKPSRYELRLEPDLKAFVFKGEESVAITVVEPSQEIVFNALELEIDAASVERSGRSVKAIVRLEPAKERAHLNFSEPLAPGEYTLKITFRGILNDKLHGFYRSQYTDAAGKDHVAATTQFESTDARRAFPCWDEPELKASYKVTLVVDENLAAISNGGQESERKLGNGKKEVIFKETIAMSTYLVAFIVGEFDATAPVDAGTPLRIVHVPGKAGLTEWAKQIGAFSLKYFANYYGLAYPGDKLDLIAIPDFASGAMENLGAITFRETALLADDKAASRAELERVADVVSHENAHMWFGDLVTMRWWNGIWLNEAFATFMEMLAVDAWKPEWKRWESFSVSRAAAMAVDGLRSTRPIEFTVHSPEECRAMFDILTYEKGAAVLRMLEQFLRPDVFREGIRGYLKKHQFDNTETSDLWDALEAASREPVRKMMDSWIFQPGFPIVDAATSANGLKLSQRRFFYLKDDSNQLWHIPVMIRARTDQGIVTRKVLMTERETTVDLGGKVDWAFLNEGGHGFYRVHYAPELLAALTRNLAELRPIERFGLVSDTWAATVAGLGPLSEFLKMARLFTNETDLNVWRAIIGAFNYLDMITADSDRPALAAAVRATVGLAAARLGWEAKPGESELDRQLRGVLIATLGTIGDDKEVQKQAATLYARFEDSPDKADRDLGPALVSILAHAGDAKRYDEFKRKFKSARTPQEEQRYLFSLTGFRDPGLLRATMDMTLDGQVRTQNSPYLMHSLLLNTASRYQAWDFIRKNWEEMTRKYPDSALPRMCEAVVALLDREDEVKNFFQTHRVRLGAKIIDQHLERLAVAIAFRKREGAKFAATLAA